MIEILSGKVVQKTDTDIVLMVGGIGFGIQATYDTISSCEVGQEITLQTYLQVKEDAMQLYGFSQAEEKAMFLRLISISGIGPKMAISILSGISAGDLAASIMTGNVSLIEKIKGVGKKTAERIVLELKEKISELISEHAAQTNNTSKDLSARLSPQAEDAVFGLVSLGIKQTEATRLVEAVAGPNMTAEQIITLALKGMNR